MTATFAHSTTQWATLSAQALGWRPDEFWRATPTELEIALRDPQAAAAQTPPTRNEIARMMERDSNG